MTDGPNLDRGSSTAARLFSSLAASLRRFPRWSSPYVALSLLVLVVSFLAIPSFLSPVSLSTAPLPHEASTTASRDLAAMEPTPKGVPAGMVEMTAASHPCWTVFFVSATDNACIQVDLTNYTNPDVVPNEDSAACISGGIEGCYNTSWADYPQAGVDIHFQVLSTIDLANCVYYDAPQWMPGGSCSASTPYQGPPGMYDGWDAYLYLTVVDVMWQDLCWFCDTDGTQWHAPANQNWAPTQGHPYTGDTTHHWVYDLNITTEAGGSTLNFPAGTWVMWNVTTNHFAPNSQGQLQRVTYCAPSCNGGVSPSPDMFYYFVEGFWYYDNAPSGTTPPYGPDWANMAPGGGPAAFGANVNLTYYPVVPAVNDQVIVDIRTQNVENFSQAFIDVGYSELVLKAWYSNGSFWRVWESPFTPVGPYNVTTQNAELTIPSAFFSHTGIRIQWFIVAYDQNLQEIQSANFTQITSNVGNCPNTVFSDCLNVTTNPAVIETEGTNGFLPTIPPSIPGVAINSDVNITITTLNASVDIQEAYLIIHVYYALSGYTGSGAYTMNRTTLNQYYILLPGLPEGSNVSFIIRAYDYNGTQELSHVYRFLVPLQVTPPSGYCFFYIQVYNAATNEPVNDVPVTIDGLAGTIRIFTTTSLNGAAYPNVTGEHWTPRFLPDNNTYYVYVNISGFDGVGLSPGNVLEATFLCQHVMNTTQVLGEASNWRVELKNGVLNFTINTPALPPVFAEAVSPGITIGMAGGMIAASVVLIPTYLYWRKQRAIAEAEEKRITL